ncbi:type 1 glutamine amidotransferase domain-containing protein [Brumicola blandensis]|jgi:putative intracellular protease/amidase|uniref:Type 1 glutamine amidotransferase domain-containing protein n=1 Tax=Brumicola blandensis TaxID=3075611 RepID=A0AAW8QZL8_9ALTE|nr:type 1 glutamine amidotransferase domain-containing protein [Alteromonas sp. W409]MDT0582065.1 type 1 glutamine amidotransferase domain-containing protein [Alteromonas sp. W409]
MEMKNILVVLTSHDALGDTGEKTGFWLEELAAPYYAFVDAGHKLTLASPAGGQPPLDPKSNETDFQTEDTHRFEADAEAKEALANTHKLADIDASQFDAIFYPGGHGPLWDLRENADSIKLIETFYSSNKPVAAVCHAPAVLLNVKDNQGNALVANKKVTGFTNGEEAAVELTDVVPVLLEDAFKSLGANYQKGDDWSSFVVEDGLLLTGQNPASSKALAELLVSKLA